MIATGKLRAMISAKFFTRLWATRVLVVSLAAVIIYMVAEKIAPLTDSLAQVLRVAHHGLLAMVVLACAAYRLANAAVWGGVLSALGHPVSTRQAVGMWLMSEACRWLPGSLWNFGSRVVIAARLGIPVSLAGAAIALELALTLGSWMMIGLAGAAYCGMNVGFTIDLSKALAGGASVLTLGLFIFAVPALRNRVSSKICGVLARFKLLRQLTLNHVKSLKILIAYALLGVFQGIVCRLLIFAMAPEQDVSLLVVVSVNALAWLAGFVAVFAPAGLGVREGTFVLLLSPYMPWEVSTLVALAWRLAQIGAELICIGLLGVLPRKNADLGLQSVRAGDTPSGSHPVEKHPAEVAVAV